MPPLEPPRDLRTITLPERRALVAADTDVLVVGGGPSGLAAAIGAADAGARVIVAERYGFFGGNATAALVMPLMSFHTQRPSLKAGAAKLMPADHGPGEPVIAGVLQKFLERLVRSGAAVAPSEETGYVVPFDPELFKLAALDLLDEAKVHFLLHSLATDIVARDGLEGVVFETKSGTLVIKASTIIDCTGDGDIAARAGADYEIGRTEDNLTQPMTLMFRMVDFQQEAFERYVHEHPDQWRGVHGLWDLVKKATLTGDLDLPREDILFFGTPHAREVAINSTRVWQVLGTNVWDLTYAESKSRQQMAQIVKFLKRYVPGFAESYAVQSGVTIGVRETRRIIGEYQLTADDVLNARRFNDAIARGSYPVDVHNPAGKGTVLKRLPPGESYDIPLRCLIPRRIDNILVAGRCISGTHEAHSSYRVMPIAMATGHAAGVAAALAARSGRPPRQVPAAEVQAELIRQGANLPRTPVPRKSSA